MSNRPNRLSLASARAALGAGALLFALFAFATSAFAAPVHPRDPSRDLTGSASDPGATHPAAPFNHACGTTVDSEGDVYVASAGNVVIDVFNPAHEYLTSITSAPPNELADEPCGLAVDSAGKLYVSEKAVGKVVRYTPNAYPFVGIPTYGAPTTIDSSGDAKGISVDPFDDRLYVAQGDRVDTYDAQVKLGIDEVQRILPFGASGTYTLTFDGQSTDPLPSEATHSEVQAALEGLSTVGAGNVSVTEGPNNNPQDHLVTFIATLASTNVPPIEPDFFGLPSGGYSETDPARSEGFNGHIGLSDLTNATGVAAHTFPSGDRYLAVADDAATDVVKIFSGTNVRNLKPRATVDGADTPDGSFGFGAAGAYLTADSGYCPAEADDPAPEQACTAGHFFLYDDAHEVLDEFEANGRYLTQITKPQLEAAGFADAEPSAVAVDRSGGPGGGTLYLSAGNGAAAKLLAFGALAPPRRRRRPEPPLALANACGVAVDSFGNRYVDADTRIKVYDPSGEPIEVGPSGQGIEPGGSACQLAVDSEGYVIALVGTATKSVVCIKPAVYPPVDGTQYGTPTTIATKASVPPGDQSLVSVGVNPANGHVFVSNFLNRTIELKSCAEGAGVVNPDFAAGLNVQRERLAVYGVNGNVYATGVGVIAIIDPEGKEVLSRITGAGSPKGTLPSTGAVTVDQSNGHLLVASGGRGVGEEYEPSGAFVAKFGSFHIGSSANLVGIAVDNSGGANDGDVFVATTGEGESSESVFAFDPLTYGEPPVAVTGVASGLGGGNATLNGTVDPRGFPVTDCHFDYSDEASYQANPFAWQHSVPCAEPLAQIGSGSGTGTGAVPVHADLTLLDPEGRYHLRLVAANEFGTDEGDPGLFGPPVLTTRTALPIAYTEATLRAQVDPSGLPTTYRFEYGETAAYGQSTPLAQLPPGDGPVDVAAPLFGLAGGATYHFRILAENDAKAVPGPDQTLTTPARVAAPPCPNEAYRSGLSANLPDCRAYELVTPADSRGLPVGAVGSSSSHQFNNWLTPPRGPMAGERLAFFTGPLPGFDGNGQDGYRVERGAGAHPAEGWPIEEIFSPTFAQTGEGNLYQQGVSSDQLFSFWQFDPIYAAFEETFPAGTYLRTPAGFEPVGQGPLGTDLTAQTRYVSAGGTHVLFDSSAHLHAQAPPAGTRALYDRPAGSAAAAVLSLLPGEATPAAGQDASYIASTEDGSAVLFEIAGALYLRRGGETTEIAAAPNTFAGLSEDGRRVFYADQDLGTALILTSLFVCDTQAGPCVGGANPPGLTEIAPESIFANVSAEGTRAYFISKEVLDDEAKGTADEYNLYAWDGAGTDFVAVLDPQDMAGFAGVNGHSLRNWTVSLTPFPNELDGRGIAQTRSNPDGSVLLFRSHAQLSAYDNEGFAEVYRYDRQGAPGGRLLCISCNPTGAPAGGEATLADLRTMPTTLIPNLTDDGQTAFFHSPDRLLPEDANDAQDVYEWKAQGSGGCSREGGCLALISSGQGDNDSYLFSMSADGHHDVFIATQEKLVSADIPGSPSIYDARVDGGIPDPPVRIICQGDACQGQGSTPPALPAPASAAGSGDGNVRQAAPKPRCPKGKRKVRRAGKTRCVSKHRKGRRHGNRSRQRANHDRGVQR